MSVANKTYRIRLANGSWSDEISYAEICFRLNINHDSKFVKITSYGTIGATSGKISEFKALLKSIVGAQYVPTKKLITICNNN